MYYNYLFGIEEDRIFINAEGQFSGKIKGINGAGMLKIEKGNKDVVDYDLKEIQYVFSD